MLDNSCDLTDRQKIMRKKYMGCWPAYKLIGNALFQVCYSVLLCASLSENLTEMQLTKCLVGPWFQLRFEET